MKRRLTPLSQGWILSAIVAVFVVGYSLAAFLSTEATLKAEIADLKRAASLSDDFRRIRFDENLSAESAKQTVAEALLACGFKIQAETDISVSEPTAIESTQLRSMDIRVALRHTELTEVVDLLRICRGLPRQIQVTGCRIANTGDARRNLPQIWDAEVVLTLAVAGR